MPKTAHQHDDGQVDVGPSIARLVATQGKVEIVAKEGGQGDMPAPPKVRDGIGLVRRVEVFWELETEHSSQSNRHVRVSREIEVDLEGESSGSEPCSQGGGLVGGKGCVGHDRDGVGQEDFFGKAQDEKRHARGESLECMFSFRELDGHGVVPHDRTGDQLGKQGHEAREVDESPNRISLSTVHVDGVAHGLEGVKGDADRQGDPDHAEAIRTEHVQKCVEVLLGEHGVFEDAEQSQIGAHGNDQRQFSAPGGGTFG